MALRRIPKRAREAVQHLWEWTQRDNQEGYGRMVALLVSLLVLVWELTYLFLHPTLTDCALAAPWLVELVSGSWQLLSDRRATSSPICC